MRQTLLDDDADWLSTVEITTGDETDEELKQLNAMSKRHSAISGRSALAKNVLLRNVSHNKRRKKDDEESPEDSLFSSETRSRFSTWDAIDTSDTHVQQVLDDVAARSLTDREWDRSEGHYRHTFDASVTLEHQRDAVQHTNSIYSNRALALPDFWAYHSFVTPLEEKRMVAELMRLLLKPVAAFHAQEGRYCVNLYEKRLGTLAVAVEAANVAIGMNERAPAETASPASSSTAADHCLAFSIQHDAPTLYAVLQRAARTELIPAMPNVVQVSEMVSAFAGYAPHLKHPSIGSYFGILNLVSSAQLGFVHRDMPWSPKAMLLPRAMYVFGPEVLRNYRVGYQHLDREWETHQDRSRFTKDYRIEVMFATVDAETVPRLQGAVRATDAAERKAATVRGESGDSLVVPPTSAS
jgi:hypothetical protein